MHKLHEDLSLDENLLRASYLCEPGLVLKCLSMGAKINARDEESGETALHFAVGKCSPPMVAFLLGVDGVDLNIKDRKGRRPIDAARQFGYGKIVAILDEHQSRRRTPRKTRAPEP